MRNGWVAIWLDSNQSFIVGLSQILVSMALIELAKPGQEVRRPPALGFSRHCVVVRWKTFE